MITVLLILGLIISLGVCVASLVLVKNLLIKIGTYEKWILEFKSDVMDTLANMRAIDIRANFVTHISGDEKGGFESDDEVGVIFKEMLDLIEKLNKRTQ